MALEHGQNLMNPRCRQTFHAPARLGVLRRNDERLNLDQKRAPPVEGRVQHRSRHIGGPTSDECLTRVGDLHQPPRPHLEDPGAV